MSTPPDPPSPGDEHRDSPGRGDGQGYGQGHGQGYGQGPGYGYGPPPGGPPVAQQTNGVAVASLVAGIVSVTLGWCCVLFALGGPVAVVLGKQGQRRADQSGGRVGGRGMATAGFVLGIIGCVVLLFGVAWIVYVVSTGQDFTYRFDTSTNGLSS